MTAFLPACKSDDPCTEITWYQDADNDGLGNAAASMKSCDQPTGYVANSTDTDDGTSSTGLHAAFAEFDTNSYTIYADGDDIVIESDGMPNHSSPYWSNTTPRTAIDPMGEDAKYSCGR